jgi:cytochrome c-type biogenesis protein CcmH
VSAFVLIASVMAVLSLALLLRPLWWRGTPDADDEAAKALADARDQLRQLDAMLASGTLTEAQAADARARLEQRIGRTMTQPVRAAPVAPARPTQLLAGLTLFMLALVIFGYSWLGTPQALDPQARAAAAEGDGTGHAITSEQIEGMISKLAARLKERPDDVDGWAMLGRSYAVLGKHEQASGAFKQALALRPDDAMLLADYADTLAMVNGRNLEGEPSRLIARALEIDPNNLKALSLAGSAAFVRKDYPLALRYWEKMTQVAPDSEYSRQIQGGIDEARKLAGLEGSSRAAAAPATAAPEMVAQAPVGPKPRGAATLSGVVKLASTLAAKTSPEDTVFVYARAVQGPRMPLAILRKQVKDLPLQFTLDDSMAMSPAAKLSTAQQVIVSARVSKRGEATPQPGDFQGQSSPVAPGATGLTIEIGQVIGQ